MVFDLTKESTFDGIQRFLEEVKKYCDPKCIIYIVGNKLDLVENGKERAISQEYINNYANKYGYKYLETSAVSNYNISSTFMNLLEGI